MNIEEEDLSREIFPLSHYASNRKRLIEEAFSILRGHKLESTIPASLRGIDYTELKSLCLEELEKIDTLRIVDIIEGRVNSEPSKSKRSQYSENRHATKRKSSETEGEVAIPVSVLKKKIKKSIQKENLDEDDSPKHTKETKALKEGKKKKEKKKKKSKKTDPASPVADSKKVKGTSKTKLKSKGKVKKSKKSKKLGKEKKKSEKEEPQKQPVVPGERTLMELLELEYRAKAIKALLKFQGFGSNNLDDVFDDNETSKDVTTVTNSQAKVSSSSSSEQPVQKPKEPIAVTSTPIVSPKQKIPSPPQCTVSLIGSDSVGSSKKAEENSLSDVQSDEKDSISSDDSCSEEEAITNSIKPATSNSDSKFELSIDVEDDLDYGNPDDVLMPADDIITEAEPDNPNNADSAQSKSPSSNRYEGDEYSEEEEGEIVFQTSSRSSKFRNNKRHLEESNLGDIRITVQNNARYSNHGSDIESEDEFQTGVENTVTSSPIKSPAKLESVSESEEGELSGNDDLEKVILPSWSSPKNRSENNAATSKDHDAVEVQGISSTSPPTKSEQPAIMDSVPAKGPIKFKKITITLPNVDDDLDYDEVDDDEALNINMPPPADYPNDPSPRTEDPDGDQPNLQYSENEHISEYPEDAEPISEYPDGAEPINEYPDDAEPLSEYPDEATPITWYERWYSSKKVQKLVNSTKMCGKVRNKMRSDKKKQIKEPATKAEPSKPLATKLDEPDVPIIGSIEEYEKLFGKKIVSQNLDNTPLPVNNEINNSPAKSSEDEADDDDDDELWGDIMGSA